MKISKLFILLPLLAAMVIQPACSVGRRMVPQSDIEAYEVGAEEFGTKILIASRDSDFKVEVAKRLEGSLKDKPVYVRFIGLDHINDEDVSQYSAIIVMTKCIAWDVDRTTEEFLKKNAELSSLVVLFTSGNGDWKPDMEGKKFDAVTSASVLTNAGTIAEEILEKVYAILDAEA